MLVFLLRNSECNNSEKVIATDEAISEELIRVLAPYESKSMSEALLKLAESYSALEGNPRVEVEFFTKNDFQKEISMNLDQNNLADLIICDNTSMPALIHLEVLCDISRYVKGQDIEPRYSQNQWNNTRSDGKFYGIPFTNDPYVLIYNKNLFKEHGVEIPNTWEELLTAVKKAEKVGIYGIGIGAKQPEEITALFLQLLYSTGGSIREINSEEGLKVFELLYELKNNKFLPMKCINWTQLDLTYKFMEGEVAMMLNTMSSLGEIKSGNVEFEVGVSAVPYEKKENYMFHGKNIGISIHADYYESINFLDYVIQEQIVQEIADKTESIPTQITMGYNFVDDGFTVSEDFIRKQRENGIAKSSLNSWFDISAAIADGVFQFLSETNPSSIDIAELIQDRVRIAIIEN